MPGSSSYPSAGHNMNRLRVLITNQSLWFRSGTEMYARDLALVLARRGHEPVVFSPRPGVVADELRAAGVRVTSNLDRIHGKPDVIHAHHTLETLEALSRFPNTPA